MTEHSGETAPQPVDPVWAEKTVNTMQDALDLMHLASIPDTRQEIHERYVALLATIERSRVRFHHGDQVRFGKSQPRVNIRRNLVAARDLLQGICRKKEQILHLENNRPANQKKKA